MSHVYMAYHRLMVAWLSTDTSTWPIGRSRLHVYIYMSTSTWHSRRNGVHAGMAFTPYTPTWLTCHYSLYGLDIGATVVFTKTPLFHRYLIFYSIRSSHYQVIIHSLTVILLFCCHHDTLSHFANQLDPIRSGSSYKS